MDTLDEGTVHKVGQSESAQDLKSVYRSFLSRRFPADSSIHGFMPWLGPCN